MGHSRPFFVYFCPFVITISIIQIEKSIDGLLGIQTWGCRMLVADETTELWRSPFHYVGFNRENQFVSWNRKPFNGRQVDHLLIGQRA